MLFGGLCLAALALAPPVAPEGGVVLLGAADLSHTHDGQRYLFQRISFGLARGSKSALVGTNGAGKSSLLRVLGGMEKAESGSVEIGARTRLAYVEQEPALPEGVDASEFLFSSSAPAVRALREYRAAAAAADEVDGADDPDAVTSASEKLGRAAAAMDSTDGWAVEAEMVRLCESLDVGHLLNRPAATLSGGERKRVALAAALLQSPELLLLDEPTNHLDIDAIKWLERELASRDLTALVVTHDRAFLSATCSEVLELDRAAIYRHRGDYEAFLTSKAARLEAEGQQTAAACNKLRAELKWVSRQPKARSTKSKSRLEAYEALASRVGAARSRANAASGSLAIEATTQRLGSAIVSFEEADVDALNGAPVLRSFTYDFKRGERIGIVGPNGAGKSTMLRALMGDLPLVAGELLTGETVVFGYYDQRGLKMPPDMRVLDFVREAVARAPGGGKSGEADEREASGLLGRFLFPPSRWGERIGTLSGGEQRRLQLLGVLAKQPNFLLLDEPTNDLDLASIQVLEDFLLSYTGVLLVVSHDRYFLDKASKPLSDFEMREMNRLEGEIDELNTRRDGLQQQVGSFDAKRNGYEELKEWTDEAEALEGKIAAVEEKWLALAERA